MTSPFLAAVAGALAAPWPVAEAISVYPAPGVRTANPQTQISLRGAPADALGRIVVRGSRSGRHKGRLRAHSDGEGASFVPRRRFAEGERVTVKTRLDIVGAKQGDFKFRIARRPPLKSTRPADLPGEGSGPVQRFVSRPDLVPPTVAVTRRRAGRAPGLIFIGPKGGRGQEGVMILDDAGEMVWFKPARHRQEITDFRAQTYRGRPVLTWWQGRLVGGDGRGVGLIYDDRYRLVRRVRMGNGYSADLHEFQLTPNGTALMIAYDPVIQDLRAFGGNRRGIVIDGVVQEIDIATGLVLFEWHSIGDIGLQDTRDPVPEHRGSWDYVHLNSVALDGEGDFIISARHTSAIYKVDRATADVVWRLGGRRSSFRLGPGATFREQHDARPLPDGTITVFDNATPPPLYKRSRAITLRLDTERHTATLERALTHPGLLSSTQGNVSMLPNGNTFVGWGSQRWFSEYDAAGKLVLDGHIAPGNDTYRAYRLPWSGTPAQRPRAVARRKGANMTVHASWNGATGVAQWQLLAGTARDALEPAGTVERAGFETAITAPRRPYAAMRALDADGAELATSAVVRVR